MKRNHPITAHDLGEDAPLSTPLEEFEQGANREHVLRLVIADRDGCERHVVELVGKVAANVGSSTVVLGLAMSRVTREFGVIGIPIIKRIPGMPMVLANLTDAAEAGGSPGASMRNTLGAMSQPVRRTLVGGAVAIINAPSLDALTR